MSERIVTVALLVIAVIHLLPLSGILGAERLGQLYGVTIEDRNLLLLMQHRAVLFGLLGSFFVYAAFNQKVQLAAFVGAGISVTSFLLLAWLQGTYNRSIGTVVLADVVAAIALFVGMVAYWVGHRQ